MRKEFFGLAVLLICVSLVSAQSTKTSTHVVPTGKGWGVEAVQGMAPGLGKPYAVTTGNGINYHNGPVMHGTVNVYFIWYGNWTNGAHASDSQSTVTLLNSLFGSSGMNNSNYYKINTTYGDTTANVSGGMVLAGSTTDNYSQGTRLRDAGVKTVVSNAISSGRWWSRSKTPARSIRPRTTTRTTTRRIRCATTSTAPAAVGMRA